MLQKDAEHIQWGACMNFHWKSQELLSEKKWDDNQNMYSLLCTHSHLMSYYVFKQGHLWETQAVIYLTVIKQTFKSESYNYQAR